MNAYMREPTLKPNPKFLFVTWLQAWNEKGISVVSIYT